MLPARPLLPISSLTTCLCRTVAMPPIALFFRTLSFTVDHVLAVRAFTRFKTINHVAYVESINSDGTVNVSVYNYHIIQSPFTYYNDLYLRPIGLSTSIRLLPLLPRLRSWLAPAASTALARLSPALDFHLHEPDLPVEPGRQRHQLPAQRSRRHHQRPEQLLHLRRLHHQL